MAETWNKKEREKKKQQSRKEKAERRQERKDHTRDGNNLENMLAYIDENGNLIAHFDSKVTPVSPEIAKYLN